MKKYNLGPIVAGYKSGNATILIMQPTARMIQSEWELIKRNFVLARKQLKGKFTKKEGRIVKWFSQDELKQYNCNKNLKKGSGFCEARGSRSYRSAV